MQGRQRQSSLEINKSKAVRLNSLFSVHMLPRNSNSSSVVNLPLPPPSSVLVEDRRPGFLVPGQVDPGASWFPSIVRSQDNIAKMQTSRQHSKNVSQTLSIHKCFNKIDFKHQSGLGTGPKRMEQLGPKQRDKRRQGSWDQSRRAERKQE